ncbi:MAG: TlpA disulfide reductase family protein [Lachnospiraceae bacterium]|nr:TlpA disulfide reductase family protein [Lachnospiraceae bacterium]
MKRFIGLIVFILLFTGCSTQEKEIIDLSIPISNEAPTEETETDDTDISESEPNNTGEKLRFSTVDINGNTVTDDIIKGSKLVMINFWEPWCGPCVGEMPGLEDLYENYKDQGLLILGVYSTAGMDDEVRSILDECNTSYPVICSDSNLERYMTDYVPTTVFADSEGNIISSEPIIGANSYSDWEIIIEEYLK